MTLIDAPIRQVAYFVADVRAAALAHHHLFSSGPFFVADHIPLRRALHHGVERELDHSSAYGQWGDVMIEFVQQNNPGPSAFHDLYPESSGRFGIHHVAIFADHLEQAMARLNDARFPTALDAEMMDGFRFLMIDCSGALGHMVELYNALSQLTDFCRYVAKAAKSFQGGEVLQTIRFD
jgi:hypothetical protein